MRAFSRVAASRVGAALYFLWGGGVGVGVVLDALATLVADHGL